MLPVRKKRVLNEAAAIRTILLQFGRTLEGGFKEGLRNTISNAGLGTPFANYVCDRLSRPLPARQAGRHTGPPPEVPRQMALVGESRDGCDFGQRKLGLTNHALRTFQPPA